MIAADTTWISFVSSKGGSGKTVTSSAMGTFLATLGFKVLLVDTDAATNGMTLLFLEQLLGFKNARRAETTARMVGLFEAEGGRKPDILRIDDTLHFLPASYSMRDTEKASADSLRALLFDLKQTDSEYDFIFLDAQAGSDIFARVAVEYSDGSVLVSEYDPVSAQGLERLKILFSDVLDPASTWTLFNKVLPEFAASIGETSGVTRYLAPIPWDADVVRAFVRRDLAVNVRTPNAYTLAIAQVALGLFPDKTFDKIQSWQENTFGNKNAPLAKKISELEQIIRKLSEEESKNKSFRVRVLIILFGIASGLTFLNDAYVWFYVYLLGHDTPSYGNDVSNILEQIKVLSPVLFGSALLYALATMGKDSAASPAASALKDAQAEREKLVTARTAAQAALRLERAGFYAERRRKGVAAGADEAATGSAA
jgi:cellulose biosynthesis protein BcsQ